MLKFDIIQEDSFMQETQESTYNNKMIEAFVNKDEKTLWYQDAFSKYNVNGIDTLKWHWSWWAFFGGFGFLLYRKAYLASLLLFVAGIILGVIPFAGIVIMIVSGGLSTYFVYKVYKSKKEQIEARIVDENERIETMREIGGYHQWVIWVYTLIMLFVFFGFLSFMSTTMLL